MNKVRAIGFGLGMLLFQSHPFAQPGTGPREGAWGPRGAYQGLYNPKTVESLKGVVLSVDTFSVAPGGRAGIHCSLNRGKDTVDVHLGPQWYLENQEMSVSPGDTLHVKGSKIAFNGKPAFLASEVRKGEDVLTLRDAKGYPAWSGWRRRR